MEEVVFTKKLYGVLKSEFRAYQEVQMDAQYNMYDPIARKQAGLEKSTWIAIMQNYMDLYDTWGGLK